MSDFNSADLDSFSFDSFGIDSELDAELQAAGGGLHGGVPIAVVDADQAVRDYLSGLLDGPIDTAASLADMETRLGPEPVVVVLGPSCASDGDLAVIEQWSRVHPNVGCLLVTGELSTALLQRALRVGVKDVIGAPIDADLLSDSIARIAEGLASNSAMSALAGMPEAPAPDFAGDGEVAPVLSIFSTKGGSGKSVTATNLAVVMAQRSEKPVVLIDGHLQFGDVAVMLKLQPQHTVVDAVGHLGDGDPGVLRQLMTEHEPSGLLVLPAPVEPTFADQVTGEQMVQLIELVRTFAAHVVVDLPAIFNEVVLSILEVADDIVLVAGLDIPNIKNVKIGLGTLAMLEVPPEKLHLVLNRADSKVKLDVTEVERTLRVAAMAHVPSDVIVPISVNKGAPVVLSAPKSAVSRAFEQLAQKFLDGAKASPAPAANRRKFFG
ncbi:MAG: hypothetical protein AAF467_15205 [Actinomycetota bacterium]